MPISQHFRLGKGQAELDFVDVDTARDMPVFLDPHLIGVSSHPFALRCHATLESFFGHFLDLLRADRPEEARALFMHFHEPNETCFGVSVGVPSGRGIGVRQANDLFESVRRSRAAETGLLEHLQDCAIFVRGVERDKVSDMTTNIVRGHLLEYTRQQCVLHGMPLRADTAVGPLWDTVARRWVADRAEVLVVDDRPVLLVPKGLVSFAKNYSLGKYHQHFVLEFLKREQFRTNGPFVHRRQLVRGGERVWVSKAELKERIAPAEKDFVSDFTNQNPAVFGQFRDWAAGRARPLGPGELDARHDSTLVAQFLVEQLEAIVPGNDGASRYHSWCVSALEFLFHPQLTCPVKEREIHQGRKRIDIAFDNAAGDGVFRSLHEVHRIPCPYIMVECKNYGREIGNPETDQLAGRFSPNRGQVGLLLCRSIENRERLLERCRDTLRDSRGLLLPLCDDDMLRMLRAKVENPADRHEEVVLRGLVRAIVLA